jgi:hypothetical protein
MGLVVGMINTKNLEIGGEIPLANPSLKSPQLPFNKGGRGDFWQTRGAGKRCTMIVSPEICCWPGYRRL